MQKDDLQGQHVFLNDNSISAHHGHYNPDHTDPGNGSKEIGKALDTCNLIFW